MGVSVAFCAAVRLSGLNLNPDLTRLPAMKYLPCDSFYLSTRKTNTGVIGLNCASLRLIVFFNSGNKGQRKEYFATNKKWLFVKKILKVVLRQT